MTQVCSTEYAFHALLNPELALIDSILADGLRPLSDFPDSERWQQFQKHMPGFYEQLYEMVAMPIIQKPYPHSGIFVSPIDFRLLPDSTMHNRTRIRIPIERLDPEWCCLTYVDVTTDERVSLPLTAENLQQAADLWPADQVTEWFAKDPHKIFFYVPQIAVYQKNIHVEPEDIQTFEN